MLCKTSRKLKGMCLGLAMGAAIGAAGCCCMCGMPSKRKLKRKFLHTADSMGSTLENILCMIK